MRSYRPEELFDEGGRLLPELAELAPKGDRRMGTNPHANGGKLLRELHLPDFRKYAVSVPYYRRRGWQRARARPVPAQRDQDKRRTAELPGLRSRRDDLQSAGGRFEVTNRQWDAETVANENSSRPVATS